ncbi:MAG: hypothetical protein L6422_04325 [Candidatus Marinimicrobia bacterium]|nr:hypothetical protein [Candidatus Neomarinimicrobiota bacterium]
MKKVFTILFALVIVTGVFVQKAQAQETVRYVTTTGAGSYNGIDWDNAFEGLQAALTAATAGLYH